MIQAGGAGGAPPCTMAELHQTYAHSFTFIFRIGDVIAETVRQKRDFQIQYPQNGRAPGTPQPSLSGRDRLKAMSGREGQPRVERPDDRNDSYPGRNVFSKHKRNIKVLL